MRDGRDPIGCDGLGSDALGSGSMDAALLAADPLALADQDPMNIVDVSLAAGVELPEERLRRASYVTSACGVCGQRRRCATWSARPS